MTDIPVFDFSQGWVAILQVLLAIIIPVLVGLITDRLTASWVKALILAALSALSVLVTSLLEVLTGGGTFESFDWVNAVGTFIVSVGIAQLSYLGLWQKWGVTQAAQNTTALQLFGPSPKRFDAEKTL